jgi:hypothetical protein
MVEDGEDGAFVGRSWLPPRRWMISAGGGDDDDITSANRTAAPRLTPEGGERLRKRIRKASGRKLPPV